MATTYKKVRAALEFAATQEQWESISDLAVSINLRRIPEFRLRGTGRSAEYVGTDSVARLLRFMLELDLLKQTSGKAVAVSAPAVTSLETDPRFNRQVRAAVRSYLDASNLPLQTIIEVASSVKLPEVPNAETLFAKLDEIDHNLKPPEFRRVLFLLACAEGLDRRVRVHYGSGGTRSAI